MKHAIKIKNDWIETTADLFVEWFHHKQGHKIGIKQFLKDEKLDKLFTPKEMTDIMSGEARLPLKFAAPMMKSCPFELSLKEASDIISTTRIRFRFAYEIDINRANLIAFHSMFMTQSELDKLKKDVKQDIRYDDEYKNVVSRLGKDPDVQFLNYRKEYLKQNGFDITDWSEDKIRTYKIKVGKTKKQRTLDCKRRKMLKRGVSEARSLSYEEIEAFKFPVKKIERVELSAEEVKVLTKVYNKKFRMKSRGVDVSNMSNEQILDYNLPARTPGRVAKNLTKDEEYIYQKRRRMRKAGVDEASMKDDEVRAYIKPRTDLSIEQRKINNKRKALERRGFDVSSLTDEDVAKDRRYTGRKTNQQVWLDIKRKKMIAQGIENAESMTNREVKKYSKYNLNGESTNNPKLYNKKWNLDNQKIDYSNWTDAEILEFDGRKRDSLDIMMAKVAQRKALGIDVTKENLTYPEEKVCEPKIDKVEKLKVLDDEKNSEFANKTRKYYQNKKIKQNGDKILAILNGIMNNKKSHS